MTRQSFTLINAHVRQNACRAVMEAPQGARVEVKEQKRTSEQNAKLWSMLGEVAKQVRWHGLTLASEDWKIIFLDALHRETRMVPNLDGNGFVALGRSSSALTVGEMADLITLITAFGAQHGVVFGDEEMAA